MSFPHSLREYVCIISKLKLLDILLRALSLVTAVCPDRVSPGSSRAGAGDMAKQEASAWSVRYSKDCLWPSWLFQFSLHVPSCSFPHPLANSGCKPAPREPGDSHGGLPWGRGSASLLLEARERVGGGWRGWRVGKHGQEHLRGPLGLPLLTTF